MTTSWSPATCTCSTVQWMRMSTPGSPGPPERAGSQSSPSKRRPVDEPKRSMRSRCAWPRTLTVKRPASRMRGQDRPRWSAQKSTRGGSSETEAKDWQAKPTGSPSAVRPVTTVTPVAKWPRAWRMRSGVGSPRCSSPPVPSLTSPRRLAPVPRRRRGAATRRRPARGRRDVTPRGPPRRRRPSGSP